MQYLDWIAHEKWCLDGIYKQAAKHYGEQLQSLKAISYSYLDLDLDT